MHCPLPPAKELRQRQVPQADVSRMELAVIAALLTHPLHASCVLTPFYFISPATRKKLEDLGYRIYAPDTHATLAVSWQ